MQRPSHLSILLIVIAGFAVTTTALADVIPPERVSGLTVDKTGADVVVGWNAVGVDIQGNGESVAYFAKAASDPSRM